MPQSSAVSPEPRLAGERRRAHPHLRAVPAPALRVVDVALFYGERSGGIRTYLDAKAAHARTAPGVEHHVVVPGPQERHGDGWHELPSLRVGTSNGYRLPIGVRALKATLRELRPDVVLLHDPIWGAPRSSGVVGLCHALGARVVAVHHGSSELDAAGLPGPDRAWRPVLRAWLRRAYGDVDAIMSVVDPRPDCGRGADVPLRFGVHPAFRPRPDEPRGDHVLYVGRLCREKGVDALLDAAARSAEPWPLHLVGAGYAADAFAQRARRLGVAQRVSFRPHLRDREALARAYAGARCVVMPGHYETFGLVALEAAACGAPVVACTSAPSAAGLGALAHRFEPDDVDGLLAAIEAARAAPRRTAQATALAEHSGWPAAIDAELADLRALVAR